MPDFPLTIGGTRSETAGADTAASTATSVAASVSTNTKGSFTQLIASTGFDAIGLVIFLRRNSLNGDALIDIAIGGSGSEQVIIPDMGFASQSLRYGAMFYIPVKVPAGSRISARCQATTGSATVMVEVITVGGGLIQQSGFSRATNYGANTADSGGVSIDPGGTINTKGAYSEITSATTAPINWLVVFITNQNNATTTLAAWLFDIAIGGSGSEQVIVENLPFVNDSNLDVFMPLVYAFPVSIPVGSRIAVRAQCSINDATDRLFDINMIGVG